MHRRGLFTPQENDVNGAARLRCTNGSLSKQGPAVALSASVRSPRAFAPRGISGELRLTLSSVWGGGEELFVLALTPSETQPCPSPRGHLGTPEITTGSNPSPGSTLRPQRRPDPAPCPHAFPSALPRAGIIHQKETQAAPEIPGGLREPKPRGGRPPTALPSLRRRQPGRRGDRLHRRLRPAG